MSGVRTGTRLDQLRALRARIDQEIAAEERRVALEAGRPLAPMPRFQRFTPARARLAELGVTGTEVNAWALKVGLITEKRRGRVPLALIEAYAMHVGPKDPKP